MLVIIDMIEDFVNKDGALYVPGAENLIGPINERLKWHMNRGSIVIILTDYHKPTDAEFKRFPKHAVEYTEGARIIAELDTEELFSRYWRRGLYHHIPKTRYNGFYGTNLEEILVNEYRPWKPRPIEVCGVCTSICVMDTIGGLACMDYNITVHEDCVADLTPEDHNYALARMERLYGVNIVRRK